MSKSFAPVVPAALAATPRKAPYLTFTVLSAIIIAYLTVRVILYF